MFVDIVVKESMLYTMVVNFHGEQNFMAFVRFLIYEVLYVWCLRYNICSTWFLDFRISTCYSD